MAGLTHVNERGEAHMVDVSAKDVTRREAIAEAVVEMRPQTLDLIVQGRAAKGDVLGVARLAGVMAAKRTADLIPLCHPLALSAVRVDLSPAPERNAVRITATVTCAGRTGVEMEALCAASVAALTVYDMCKAADRGMVVRELRLRHKSGGESGTFDAP